MTKLAAGVIIILSMIEYINIILVVMLLFLGFWTFLAIYLPSIKQSYGFNLIIVIVFTFCEGLLLGKSIGQYVYIQNLNFQVLYLPKQCEVDSQERTIS